MEAAELLGLAHMWRISLRAERKSAETIKSYLTGVEQFLAWCAEEGCPPTLSRATVNAWVNDLHLRGSSPATARVRQLAVRRFSAWLVEEGELPRDELLGIKPVKLDQKVVPSLSTEDLRKLLIACRGSDLQRVRDAAIINLMVDTGMRAGECVSLILADIDLDAETVTVQRGKGGKGRTVYLSPESAAALARYLRARRHHARAETSSLWLGERGKTFSYDALHKTLAKRAQEAGLTGFHPHVLRHTFATRWLSDGGSEGGLMALAGWSRRDMIDRYTRDTASSRAIEEARKMSESRQRAR